MPSHSMCGIRQLVGSLGICNSGRSTSAAQTAIENLMNRFVRPEQTKGSDACDLVVSASSPGLVDDKSHCKAAGSVLGRTLHG